MISLLSRKVSSHQSIDANIFMGKFERNFIYPFLQTSSNFYCRFNNKTLKLKKHLDELKESFVNHGYK